MTNAEINDTIKNKRLKLHLLDKVIIIIIPFYGLSLIFLGIENSKVMALALAGTIGLLLFITKIFRLKKLVPYSSILSISNKDRVLDRLSKERTVLNFEKKGNYWILIFRKESHRIRYLPAFIYKTSPNIRYITTILNNETGYYINCIEVDGNQKSLASDKTQQIFDQIRQFESEL